MGATGDCGTGCGAGTAGATLGTGGAPSPPAAELLEDGARCANDAQCASAHCDSGLCCMSGPCCLEATDCGDAAGAGVCEDPTGCQGSRGEVTCAEFRCQVIDDVEDDSACTADVEASDCGAYPAVYCSGAADQQAPPCADGCSSDADCDPDAHCNGGACVPDAEDGGACSRDEDCASAYCDGGLCCAGGDCCLLASDCPDSYTSAPVCNDPATCQGTRSGAACADFQCTGTSVPDDSACGADSPRQDCGLNADVRCTGAVEQPVGECSTFCSDDAQCDEIAHCGFVTCTADLANGGACTRDGMCQSEHCQNGFCCTDGDCCQSPSSCSTQLYGASPLCEDNQCAPGTGGTGGAGGSSGGGVGGGGMGGPP